jgi:hypothetical protein
MVAWTNAVKPAVRNVFFTSTRNPPIGWLQHRQVPEPLCWDLNSSTTFNASFVSPYHSHLCFRTRRAISEDTDWPAKSPTIYVRHFEGRPSGGAHPNQPQLHHSCAIRIENLFLAHQTLDPSSRTTRSLAIEVMLQMHSLKLWRAAPP